MCNEQVGQAKLDLKVEKEAKDLGLDRDVQRGHRFVKHDEVRLCSQCTGDADTLALTTGKLMGKSAHCAAR